MPIVSVPDLRVSSVSGVQSASDAVVVESAAVESVESELPQAAIAHGGADEAERRAAAGT